MATVPKEGLYILLALICGVAGFVALRQYVDGQINEYRSQLKDQKKLLALKQHVNAGQVLSDAMLEEVDVPAQFVHRRAVAAAERGLVVGNVVKSPLDKGEVLLWYAMDMGASASISEKISEGEKAITIPVNTVTGGGGMLRPNMRVDVYGIFVVSAKTQNEESDKSDMMATKLLDNVAVVAVGSEAGQGYGGLGSGGEDKSGYNSVTLLVKAKDVEKVLLALELGKAGGSGLYCVYRSEMETRAEERLASTVLARELMESLRARRVESGVRGKD